MTEPTEQQLLDAALVEEAVLARARVGTSARSARA
jgi:hypothetical protein